MSPSKILVAGEIPYSGMWLVILLLHLAVFATPSLCLDFLFNSFTGITNLTLVKDARVDASVIRMTNDSNQYSYGRVFYPTKVPITKPSSNSSSSSITSFSTSFVFSVLPQITTSPGFGLAFVLCNTTDPPGALASQYFGLFTNATSPTFFPLVAVEFDTGQNPEFNDIDDNHIGIDLNNIESTFSTPAGYYNSTGESAVQRNGGANRRFAPDAAYAFTLCSYHRASEELNTTNLPVFEPESSTSSLSGGAIAGIVIGCVVFVVICGCGVYLWWRIQKGKDEQDEIEDWELEYWPHRFSYEELSSATGEFGKEQLLGSGGFGRVYKGTLPNKTQIAVKCVNHDSKQGLREFMAEIESMGRLQHKNLRRPTMKEVVALLLGENPPEAPGKVLSDLVRGGDDLDEAAPLQPSSTRV
ncbi:hypothetical protein VIGAN_01399200 [Vigna angularis var. angularis]|uniref:non-specific serine/threonine protein kinase n=1 Tax=Vigna angularis var. angularis TaxID=157739 RepID=A0A0S3R614_PHAAN|nr:hypothetical protein VIGAN_01399200 [Vigna angularis var. angularis]